MQTWAPVDVPVLEGSGPPLRLHDTATGGSARPPRARRPRCTSAASPPTTPPTSATPPPTWRSTWSTGCGGTSGHDVHYVQNVTDIDDPLLERAARDQDDWVVLGDARDRAVPRGHGGAAGAAAAALHRRGRGDGRRSPSWSGKLLAQGAAYRVDDPEYPRRLLRRRRHRPVRLRVELRRGHDAGDCPASAAATPTGPASATRSTRCCGAWRARASRPGSRDLGAGPAGLAHRVRGDRAQPARHADRRQGRRLRPDLPAPRVRRRARRGAHRRAPLRPSTTCTPG